MNIQENEKNIQEIWALFRETRESMKETDRQIKAMSEESERRSRELDERFKATDRKIDKVAGMFDTQWGKLMESLAEGGVLKLFQERGIGVYQIYQRARCRRNGRHLEIDLLLADDDVAVAVEVKTTLKADHVSEFLEDMSEFPEFFPRYRNSKIYGAVAALRMEQQSERFAQKQGLFVIKIGGDGMTEMLNPTDFKAKNFGAES
jgi:hypothetical protein